MSDPDARLTHLIDQLGPEYERLQPLIASLYRTLKAAGLTEQERAICIERHLTRLLAQDPDLDLHERG